MLYIPSLTLPAAAFTSAPIAILIPLGLGIGSGLVSQPGSSAPKSFSDKPATERGTFKSRNDPIQERYMSLKQPPFRPPPWLFAPAWTALYMLMGYASHRAWMNGMASRSPTIVESTRQGATLYTVQLGLNLLFMPLFFGLGRPVEALVDIVALTGTVGLLFSTWQKVDEVASYCLIPYIAWLSFATYLTAGTGYLNGWTTKAQLQEEAKKEL